MQTACRPASVAVRCSMDAARQLSSQPRLGRALSGSGALFATEIRLRFAQPSVGRYRRKYKTEGWKGTLMVVNAVGHLAEAAWHHPDLTVSYAFVVVKLKTHTAKGITDKDFALATKIEEVIQWQPGREGGPLEGTPADDQRFRYIKYDAPKA
jgi:4a-hydroxytetrahydrobiopterin dehydratase